MSEFAVVNQAMNTSTGTQDFTVPKATMDAQTPKGALFFLTAGTVNGTTVAHALHAAGATDGTRNISVSGRSKDAVATTLTGRRSNSVDCIHLANQDGTVLLRAQFDSWVNDGTNVGVRINISVAPASAYLMTCVLIGGTGVTNVYVGTVATPTVINTGTDVTAPGFAPTCLIGFGSGSETSWSDVNNAQHTIGLGFAVKGSGNPHPQQCVSWSDTTALGTSAVATYVLTNRVFQDANSSQTIEIEDFDANGFTAVLRTLGSEVRVLGYIAIAMTNAVKVVSVDSPTSTGSQPITGVGFTPQFGMLALSATQSRDSGDSSTDAEVFAMSMFTADAQACHAITVDDATVSNSNAEAVVHNRPVFLRKDGATYIDATFGAFNSDGVDLTYATTNASVRKWVGFFVQAAATSRESTGRGILRGVLRGGR